MSVLSPLHSASSSCLKRWFSAFFWLQVFNTCFCRTGSVCMQENREGVENPVPVLALAWHGWFAWLRERAARSVESRSAGRVSLPLNVFWQQGLKPEATLSRWEKSQGPFDFPGHWRNSIPNGVRVPCCSRRWEWHLCVWGALNPTSPGPVRRGLIPTCLSGCHPIEKRDGLVSFHVSSQPAQMSSSP